MNTVLLTIHIVICLVLTTLILLQAKGVGLGRAWGGGGEFYKSRRGVEKIIFQLTIFFVFAFLVSSIANVWFF